ncbi:Glyoxalase-like domain-containing protein [Marivirga sericea]|uniref:Glyoxalase-like domain-containing protein n=2 Tax=Marivirga sericea TaxID=1028 RepID=A0A1X7K6X3_9BACT|nr:Glyoxalase-like domain-containing protein [Marivirga sericea]
MTLGFSACGNEKNERSKMEQSILGISSELMIDHFNIWVSNPEKAKEKLLNIGFNSIPDSLSQVHTGQGTAGKYFYFLNAYLELIFVYDQNEFTNNNIINEQLDFAERNDYRKNGASPFSIALKLKDYDVEKIPFEKIRYHQNWMEKQANIYSAKNSKLRLQEPSIFVVYPEIESDTFETLADLNKIPDEYAFARQFYRHPNGAKKITKIIIKSPKLDSNTKTIQSINGIKNIRVRNGTENLMLLYFDENVQGKSFDLRPDLPLIVYL